MAGVFSVSQGTGQVIQKVAVFISERGGDVAWLIAWPSVLLMQG